MVSHELNGEDGKGGGVGWVGLRDVSLPNPKNGNMHFFLSFGWIPWIELSRDWTTGSVVHVGTVVLGMDHDKPAQSEWNRGEKDDARLRDGPTRSKPSVVGADRRTGGRALVCERANASAKSSRRVVVRHRCSCSMPTYTVVPPGRVAARVEQQSR